MESPEFCSAYLAECCNLLGQWGVDTSRLTAEIRTDLLPLVRLRLYGVRIDELKLLGKKLPNKQSVKRAYAVMGEGVIPEEFLISVLTSEETEAVDISETGFLHNGVGMR